MFASYYLQRGSKREGLGPNVKKSDQMLIKQHNDNNNNNNDNDDSNNENKNPLSGKCDRSPWHGARDSSPPPPPPPLPWLMLLGNFAATQNCMRHAVAWECECLGCCFSISRMFEWELSSTSIPRAIRNVIPSINNTSNNILEKKKKKMQCCKVFRLYFRSMFVQLLPCSFFFSFRTLLLLLLLLGMERCVLLDACLVGGPGLPTRLASWLGLVPFSDLQVAPYHFDPFLSILLVFRYVRYRFAHVMPRKEGKTAQKCSKTSGSGSNYNGSLPFDDGWLLSPCSVRFGKVR